MATITKRGKAYQAKVRRKGHEPISQTFDTKSEAEAWARQIESEMDRGIFVDRTEAERTTFAEALERYETEITVRKKGAKQERLRLAMWKRDTLASRTMASLRAVDFAKWRDRRLAEEVSPTTARNDLALISHLFTIAEREWGMESLSNPLRKIRMPSAARARDRRLEGDEEQRLLAACAESQFSWLVPITRLAIETAMRQGELLSMRWKNVNLKRRVVTLVDTKNGDSRTVPLSTTAVSILSDLPRDIGGQVFPITTAALEHQFRRAVTRAKIEGLRFHDLRHEGTSRFFEQGLNPMEAAAITGHKTLAMLKRYTHLRPEELAKKLG